MLTFQGGATCELAVPPGEFFLFPPGLSVLSGACVGVCVGIGV